jgi:chromatin segregation and condensation protein Rec8/ScpA/Scc1 (kleisin family)
MFVRLEQAVTSVMRRVAAGSTVSLRSMVHGGNRTDAVMHFLAVLELVRRRRIEVTQVSIEDDILVRQVHDAAEADSRAG